MFEMPTFGLEDKDPEEIAPNGLRIPPKTTATKKKFDPEARTARRKAAKKSKRANRR